MITRRTFIKRTIQTGAIVTAGTLFPSFKPLDILSRNEAIDVAVIKGDVVRSVAKAFELLGGIEKFIKANDTVLIKPNASFPNPPNFATTTNPEVVKAVIDIVLKAGAKKVLIVDNTMQDAELCFKRNGFQEAFSGNEAVKLVPLKTDNLFEEVTVPNGKALKTVKIAKLLSRANVIINIPVAKSHAATGASFGMKNMMGLIWDRTYFHQGTELHAAIAELATVIKPHLTIVDATRVLLTNGPTGPGKVQEMNTIIAGVDPVAVDAYCTTIASWNNKSYTPQSIQYLVSANELGLGKIDVEKMVIRKESV